MDLTLASASPRRRQLLQQIGFEPTCYAVDIDETPLQDESAADYVVRLAREKACEAQKRLSVDTAILGADTVVVCDGIIFGKPKNQQHAESMLLKLSNREHQVMTGVAVVNAQKIQHVLVSTTVKFGPISVDQAQAYWRSGEPFDKAGGYAIQGFGAVFVERIDGCYFNVVGLPLNATVKLLQAQETKSKSL